MENTYKFGDNWLGFNTRARYVTFVMHKAALGQVIFRVLRFSSDNAACSSIILIVGD